MTVAVRIVEAGWATTIQDRGRPGYAHLGVPRAGPVDRERYELVNRLVGNAPGAAVLETAGGLVVEAVRPVLVARSDHGTVTLLDAGERISAGPVDGEVWGYLAVRGGIAVDPVLGSRSTDTLSGIGPDRPEVGDELSVGPDPQTELTAELAPVRRRERNVSLTAGPQADRISTAQLTVGEWVVQPGSDRVGVRLRARGLDPAGLPTSTFEMPSQPLVEGAVQLTPSGELIAMLANHPTTGGYPVVGVVELGDLGVVAQTPPGGGIRVRFVAGSGPDHTRTSTREPPSLGWRSQRPPAR